MTVKPKYSKPIQSALNEVLTDIPEKEIREGFYKAYSEQINKLYQEYLLKLACERLKDSDSILQLSVMDLPLSLRIKNKLKENKIDTIGSLISYSASEISHLPEMGQISVKQIESFLAMLGLQLRH